MFDPNSGKQKECVISSRQVRYQPIHWAYEGGKVIKGHKITHHQTLLHDTCSETSGFEDVLFTRRKTGLFGNQTKQRRCRTQRLHPPPSPGGGNGRKRIALPTQQFPSHQNEKYPSSSERLQRFAIGTRNRHTRLLSRTKKSRVQWLKREFIES